MLQKSSSYVLQKCQNHVNIARKGFSIVFEFSYVWKPLILTFLCNKFRLIQIVSNSNLKPILCTCIEKGTIDTAIHRSQSIGHDFSGHPIDFSELKCWFFITNKEVTLPPSQCMLDRCICFKDYNLDLTT